jgi:hypothetical protein
MAEVSNKLVRYLLQAVNYSVFMVIIWYFATSPSVRLIADDEAKITIAFAHAGQLREPCRMLSQEELNKLPPNMRKIDDCPRERSPVTIGWRRRRFLQWQDPRRKSPVKPANERQCAHRRFQSQLCATG